MHQAVVKAFGSPPVVTFETSERPAPAEGEVVVRVTATALGFVDGLIV
jgi:NADPH:quinone reductase-like Zn-dependent oxidoreductase